MTLRVNQLIGFGASSVIIYGTILDTSAALTSESDGWTGYTIRQRMAASAFSGILTNASYIRITIKGGTTQGFTFDKCYVGHAAGSGDAYDAASLTQLFFSGAAGAAIASGGNTVVSDDASFVYDGTSDLIVTFHVSGDATHDMISYNGGGAGSHTLHYKASVDQAATADVTGYGSSATSLVLVKLIELGR